MVTIDETVDSDLRIDHSWEEIDTTADVRM